MTRNRNKNEVF